MPTPTKGRRLGGSPAHQRLMLANLATSLFEHGKIHTTEAKARRLRPLAERLITKAKRGDLHNRREVQKVVRDKDVVHKLFAEIGPFFAERSGGYTRITKTMPRKGDNAEMAVIELISEPTVTEEADNARRRGGASKGRAKAKPTEAKAEAPTEADAEVAEPVTEADAEPEPAAEATAEAAEASTDTDEESGKNES